MAVLRNFYLLWLPIALFCLVLPVKSKFNAHQNYVRGAFANKIASLEAEYGEGIDTSLEGYDHEPVAVAIHQAHEKRRVAILNARDNIAKQAEIVKRQLGGDVDASLEGYDISAIDVDEVEDTTLGRRDFTTGFADEDDILGHRHSARSTTPLKNYEPGQADLEDEDIDFSLEGYETYEHPTLTRRADDDDDDDDDEDGWPSDVDFSLEGYDTSHLTRRSNQEDVNDRYQDAADEDWGFDDDELDSLAAQATAAAEAARAKAKRAAEGWYENVKRWIGVS